MPFGPGKHTLSHTHTRAHALSLIWFGKRNNQVNLFVCSFRIESACPLIFRWDPRIESCFCQQTLCLSTKCLSGIRELPRMGNFGIRLEVAVNQRRHESRFQVSHAREIISNEGMWVTRKLITSNPTRFQSSGWMATPANRPFWTNEMVRLDREPKFGRRLLLQFSIRGKYLPRISMFNYRLTDGLRWFDYNLNIWMAFAGALQTHKECVERAAVESVAKMEKASTLRQSLSRALWALLKKRLTRNEY